MKSQAILVLVFLCTIYDTYGEPSMCYHCDSMRGEACNDPLNTTATDRVICQNRTLTPSTKYHLPAPFDKQEVRATDKDAKICFKLTFDYNNEKQTQRSCDFAIQGAVTFCQFYENLATITEGVSNLRCHTCSTDLCNSSTYNYVSAIVFIYGLIVKLVV